MEEIAHDSGELEEDDCDEYEDYDDVGNIALVDVSEEVPACGREGFEAWVTFSVDGDSGGRRQCSSVGMVQQQNEDLANLREQQAMMALLQRAQPRHLEAARIPIAKDNQCLFNSIAYLCCDAAQVTVTNVYCYKEILLLHTLSNLKFRKHHLKCLHVSDTTCVTMYRANPLRAV